MHDLTILILFLAGLGLFWVEMYVPGGVIGLAGLIAIGVGLALAFATHGVAAGAAISAGMLAVTLVMVRHWLHTFHRSFFGSRMTNRDLAGKNDYVEVTRSLIGQRGTTLSRLQPGGKAQFGDRRLDVVAQFGEIEPGTEVEVIRVDGIMIMVRPIAAPNEV